ncbi:MAG TPA: hypothetical protein VGK23_10470 [Methanomassiliicoccales archaeon]
MNAATRAAVVTPNDQEEVPQNVRNDVSPFAVLDVENKDACSKT